MNGRDQNRSTHQALHGRLLAPAPYVALDALTLAGRPGRGLRLSRPERRRQDHHAQAADAADFPDLRARRDPRQAGRRCRRQAAHRLSSRTALLLRLPHRARSCSSTSRRSSATRRRMRRTRAAALLDEVGIGAERRLQLRKFSKGMLQRVGIAQALINDPEVVFLDEPMSGLDPLGRREIRQLILAAARSRLHRVLQLARAGGRRGALQPRGDPRQRPARDRGTLSRHPRVPGPRVGARGQRPHRRRAQAGAGARSCPARDAARRVAIRAGTAADAAARADPGGA